MQGNKILWGASLLLITFFILLINVLKPESAPRPEISHSSIDLAKNLEDKNRERRYKLQRQKLNTALKTYFDEAIASGYIVGAGVSIIKGDSILISDGFGKKDINLKEEVNGETIFRLGSLSKGFTGVLAVDLKSEGKLDWDYK